MFARPKLLIVSLVILALSGAILLANKDGRAKEIDDQLVEVASVDPQNEGKLVMVTGVPELADGGVLTDEEAGLSVSGALHYSRVPMQKVYVEKTRKVVKDKGEDLQSEVDDVTEIEHYVATTWIGAKSSRDEVIEHYGHYENPAPVNLDSYYVSSDLLLNGFVIEPAAVTEMLKTSNGGFAPEELAHSCVDYVTRSEIDFKVAKDERGHGFLATGDEVGDVQVLFSYTLLDGAEEFTMIGRQQDGALVLGEDDIVTQSESVQKGKVSKEEFLDTLDNEDRTSRWIGIGGLVLGAVLFLFAIGLFDRR